MEEVVAEDMHLDSDARLVKRISAGDRDALVALYRRHLPSVWRYVYAQLRGDDASSRDVVGETFLAAIRSLTAKDPAIASVSSWLIGIARHKIADHRRLSAKWSGGAPPERPADEDDPMRSLEAADTRCIVARVMDRMDDTERSVLEWKYLDDLSVRDIARRLGRTEKAVEAMLYRARDAFRGMYETMRGAGK